MRVREMNKFKWVKCISAVFLACFSAISAGESVTQEQVQSEQMAMVNRVAIHASDYAKKIGLALDFIVYCKSELHLKKNKNSDYLEIPFGVNYNKIDSRMYLESVLKVRESYEKSFLSLCLANVKITLNKAEK